MEKRLHNTRHAARQARNSGKASSNVTSTTTSGGASSATVEKMTVTATTASTTSNSKTVTSAPSPPPASSASHQREQSGASASSSRYRQHQQSAKQSDSSDEDNEDDDEEMEDDAASSSPAALATPTSPPSTPVTPTAAATGSAVSSATSVTAATATSSASPEQMYEGFQAWALRTYGDSAKTKTVTRKKYQRILKILKGEEQTSAENSKFRFWVKAKGFKMGLPPGHPQQSVHKAALAAAAAKTPPEQLLFVPCSKVKKGSDGETTVYKRVAVVENFFEIIYGVHVEMDGRGGKHAGQKRTYKAIAELYAFLPREAVTHFLMSCSDCQKRMHLTNGALSAIVTAAAGGSSDNSPAHNSVAATTTPSAGAAAPPPPPATTAETASPGYQSNGANASGGNSNNNSSSCRPGSGGPGRSPCPDVAGGAAATSPPQTSSAASSPGGVACSEASAPAGRAAGARIAAVSAADLDFSVPITTAYLKHMRSLGLSDEDAFNPREDSTLGSDELSDDEATPNYEDDEEASPDAGVLDSKDTSDAHMADAASTTSPPPPARPEDASSSAKCGSSPTSRRTCSDEPMDTQQPLNMTAKPTATTSPPGGSAFAVSGGSTAPEHGFADRGQSPPTAEPDDLSAGTKDEDEEDDDDEQDKLDISSYDPERLKAFNMFVRLFVDENLDRMVPISRQPKEKIQAIIDSCSRQFPEFAERARKRIRTYLKSCRRTKRTRDLNGWDGRTAVPHLTSPLAEQILASACENETNNAKRMRLGLQPLPMELDIPGRSATPGYVTVGVGGSNGASTVLGVPASLSVNSSAASMTNNVSSQLISRLTAPIVTSNASMTNGLLATSLSSVNAVVSTPLTAAASSAVTTSGVDVSSVCPFHMHHHHQQQQQQFHQHFAAATSSNLSVTSNGILTSPGTMTSSSASSSPVNSFMNGVVARAASPHAPHTHHHHKCFNSNSGNVPATNGVGLTATVTSAANGHHYHVHHRHPGSLGGTSVSASSCSSNNNNSPTDLSVKKCVGNGVDRPAMALKYSLNPAEVNAVKQLIAGYRESAAFLLRSADELEQLLLQQN